MSFDVSYGCEGSLLMSLFTVFVHNPIGDGIVRIALSWGKTNERCTRFEMNNTHWPSLFQQQPKLCSFEDF